MSAITVRSRRKWFPVITIGISLLFFGGLASFILYAFFRSVFFHHQAPNWGILVFGLVIAVFAVYLLILWLPNLTTLIVTQEAIIEIGPGGFRRIAIPDIISMNLEDEKEVKALMVSQIVSCATIHSADRIISFMYGNYDNADEVKRALQKIAHNRKL